MYLVLELYQLSMHVMLVSSSWCRMAYGMSYGENVFKFKEQKDFSFSISVALLPLCVAGIHNLCITCLAYYQELPSGSCDPLCSVDETSSSDFEASYKPKTDLLKAIAIFAAAATGTIAINHSWVAANQVHLLNVA